MLLQDKELKKIVDFVMKYSTYTDRETIAEYIQQHWQYKTAFVVYDANNEIAAVCRWNVSPSGTVATVLDLIIREDWRNKNLMRQLLTKALWTFPKLKYISFERGYDNKQPCEKPLKTYSIERFLRHRGLGKGEKGAIIK